MLELQEDAKLSQILNKQKYHQQQLHQPTSVKKYSSGYNDLSADGFSEHNHSLVSQQSGLNTSGDIGGSQSSYNKAPVTAWTANNKTSAEVYYGGGSHSQTHCQDISIQDFVDDINVQSLQMWKNEVLTSQAFKTMDSSGRPDDSSYNYSAEIQQTLEKMETMNKTVESGRGTFSTQTTAPVDIERHMELEKTCAKLQSQIAQLQQSLQSVSSVVFQSGMMTPSLNASVNHSAGETDVPLMVTGYDDDDTSSGDESTIAGPKWGLVPHSLSPYPSEEEEAYFLTVAKPGLPTPPRNLRLIHKGNNSVVLSWQASRILDAHRREMNKPLLVFVDDKPAAMIGDSLKALVYGLDPQVTYKRVTLAYALYTYRSGSDHKAPIIMKEPSTSSRRHSPSPSSVPDAGSAVSTTTNVKRTASFHGVLTKPQEVKPRRSGSEENLSDKAVAQSMANAMESYRNISHKRQKQQTDQQSANLQHIPILSGAKLQKQYKQTSPS
ncbi:hypothetical protein KUTeg_007732 [Tegillarca granosa]|uniref:Uncharacterized protein n=1 Tax=Tegillarca granosa TaxID=220873 RepID=A0ABQ9FI32_TEGGR|nr:hypothetical protein KUTeg_007732 [Tegillarca granosa]